MSDITIKPGWREIQARCAADGYRVLRKAAEARKRELSPLYAPNLWTNLFTSVSEPFTGAWQQNVSLQRNSLTTFSAVYCCITGIASDIAKLRIKLCQDEDGIWEEIIEDSPWLPVLRKPNHYQNVMKFREQWIISKLQAGNTYVLKERDKRGIVNAMYVLDPSRVTPLVAENGDVFYQLSLDYLSHVEDNQVVVPASEIMHDMMPALFHPLIGTPPLYACQTSVNMGVSIQGNSSSYFANRSMPGGMLTGPGTISDATAARLKATFESNFGGANAGRLLVAGNDLKFEPIAMTAEQSLLVEQLKWSVGDVARAFHYPEYKLGGPLPPYSGNMQALTLSYYTDCLQTLIESMESCLDEGLELPLGQGTELDTENLLRMDSQGQAEVISKLAGVQAPNESRKKINLPPVKGGNSPYLQQQNYSLEALAKRDSGADPFGKPAAAPSESAAPPKLEIVRGMTEEELEAQIELGLGREFTPA